MVDKDVFRLQIAVDDVKGVKILERQDDLRCVERRIGLAAATRATPALTSDQTDILGCD